MRPIRLIQRLAAIGGEHQNLAPVVGILDAIDEGVGYHPIDHLGQRRMIEQHGFGEFAHRMALAIRQHFQNTPLFHRHALFTEAGVELTIDLPVGLRKQVGEVFGDGFAGRSGQGIEPCDGDFG